MNAYDLFKDEDQKWQREYEKIAGVDEAGRGPIAGPVVASACILPKDFSLSGVRDSKIIPEPERNALYKSLTSNPNVYWSVSIIEASLIDELNILQATLLGMSRALATLPCVPDFALIDGRNCPYTKIPCTAIVRGDSLYESISAASIIAKVTRDKIMKKYHANGHTMVLINTKDMELKSICKQFKNMAHALFIEHHLPLLNQK